MSAYQSSYSLRDGYSSSAYGARGKEPFTVLASIAAEIDSACGTLTVSAAAFVQSPGGYASFTISKSPTGPWTASVDYGCPELGLATCYIQGDGELVLPSEVSVQDNLSWCSGCP